MQTSTTYTRVLFSSFGGVRGGNDAGYVYQMWYGWDHTYFKDGDKSQIYDSHSQDYTLGEVTIIEKTKLYNKLAKLDRNTKAVNNQDK